MINALTGEKTWGIQTLKFLISYHWHVVPNMVYSMACKNFLFRQSQAMKSVWMHYFNMGHVRRNLMVLPFLSSFWY